MMHGFLIIALWVGILVGVAALCHWYVVATSGHKQRVWQNDRAYVVLTYIYNETYLKANNNARWELELTETVDVEFYHGVQQQDFTVIEYHRSALLARIHAWRFMHKKEAT